MVVIFFLNTEKNLDVQTQQLLLTNQHKYRKKYQNHLGGQTMQYFSSYMNMNIEKLQM